MRFLNEILMNQKLNFKPQVQLKEEETEEQLFLEHMAIEDMDSNA
jgi:hypothetical protein